MHRKAFSRAHQNLLRIRVEVENLHRSLLMDHPSITQQNERIFAEASARVALIPSTCISLPGLGEQRGNTLERQRRRLHARRSETLAERISLRNENRERETHRRRCRAPL